MNNQTGYDDPIKVDEKPGDETYIFKEQVGSILVRFNFTHFQRAYESFRIHELIGTRDIDLRVNEIKNDVVQALSLLEQWGILEECNGMLLNLNFDVLGTATLLPNIFEERVKLLKPDVIRGSSALLKSVAEQIFIQLYNQSNTYFADIKSNLPTHHITIQHVQILRSQRAFAHLAVVLVLRSQITTPSELNSTIKTYQRRVQYLSNTLTGEAGSAEDTRTKQFVEIYYKLLGRMVDKDLPSVYFLVRGLLKSDPSRFSNLIFEALNLQNS